MGRHDLSTGTLAGRAGAATPRPSCLHRTDDAAAKGGDRSERAAGRKASLFGRTLAELDADPAAGALRDRCAGATPGEIRALRGEWTAAVVRALWRASTSADGGGKATLPEAPAGAEARR